MKLKIILYYMIIFLCIHVPASALNYNPTLVKGLSRAYGFILSQEYSLSQIGEKYPDLITQVELARAHFSSTFPDIKNQLEIQLIETMGEAQFHEMANFLKKNTQDIADRQKITQELALAFLKQVEDRSKGKIPTPILEYLLVVKYASNPVGEFLDGFRQRYNTDGSGKSQGIKLKLQIPKSWAKKEAERPHIVQKWVSENGNGLETIMLGIRDAEGLDPSKSEIEELVRSGDVKDAVPEGVTYLESGVFSLETRTGYWLLSEAIEERAGIMKIYAKSLMYRLFFRGKIIDIAYFLAGPNTEKVTISEAFERSRPLFQQVLNSLVLEQVY